MHDLLDDLATRAPAAEGAPSAARSWAAARRRRTRRRLAGLVSVVAVLSVATVVFAAARPAPERSLPADQPLQPGQGIPSTIYDVKPWLPTIGSDPIPPVVYAYVTPTSPRPIAISVDGSYRYLPKAPDPGTGYELSSFAISPDGEHLAMAWSQPAGSSPSRPSHALVYVYDLLTGERRGPWIGQGMGGQISDLAWRWDDHGLAWEEIRPTEPGSSSGTVAVRILDWATGDSRDLDGFIGPVTWSPDGSSVAALSTKDGEGVHIVSLSGGQVIPLPLKFPGPAVWSSDGTAVASVQLCNPTEIDATASPLCGSLVTVDARTGNRLDSRSASAFGYGTSVLGWRSGSAVLGAGWSSTTSKDLGTTPYVVAELPPVGSVRTLTVSPLPRFINEAVAAQQLLATAPVVDLPAPSQPRFGLVWWQWFWDTHRDVIVLWGVVALVLLAAAAVGLRRRTNR